MPFVDNYDSFDKEWINKVLLLYKDQLSYGKEIQELIKLFTEPEFTLNQESKEFLSQEGIKDTIILLNTKLSNLNDFTSDNIKVLIKEIQEELGVKGKMLFMPCRIATTMIMHGPDLGTSIELYGKEQVLKNIKVVLESL
ncbi:MAG: hypothetical protein ACK5HS_02115 [Mycoplasmatales bacterium]